MSEFAMPTEVAVADLPEPLRTVSGRILPGISVRYETYGTLAARRDNAVIVCHSLTKDSHAAGEATGSAGRAGWWNAAIGPGRMIDTDRHFVICASTLAAAGSTGPASPDPDTGRPYGLRFPLLEVRDMAEAHRRLLDHLGIDSVHLAIGGCFGGQQVLELAITHPATVRNAVVISTTPATSAHTIAIFAAMRRIIRADPWWNAGDYYAGPFPAQGIGNAIAAAMPLWMNRETMQTRFGRHPASPDPLEHRMDPEYEVEVFLDRIAGQATTAVDPNGLIYLTKAVEYFDLEHAYGSLDKALSPVTARTMFVSYRSDWRYPADEVDRMHRSLAAAGHDSRHVVLDSPGGHGDFIFDVGGLRPSVEVFLAGADATSCNDSRKADRA